MSMPSSLSARLAALQRQSGQAAASSSNASNCPQRFSYGLAQLATRRRNQAQNLERRLRRRLDVPLDDSGVIELNFSVPLCDAGLNDAPPSVLCGPPWSQAYDVNRLVFIDTETTGLSGGSGTLVFQVGLGWFAKGALQVYQALLTRPGAETQFLKAIVSKIPDDTLLVSYNGKSFDLPLLVTRQRMNQLADNLSCLPHEDLLYAVRRAFRQVWPNCTLKSAESRLLGVERVDDLPGAMAPEAWKAFLQGRSYKALVGVLRHNQQDIVSLAGLAVALTDVYRNPAPHAADLSGVAQSWLDDNQQQAETILEQSLPDDHRAKLMLADLRRRTRGYDAAVSLWQKLAERFCCTESLRRLAIYYEHHKKDPKTAYAYARLLVMQDEKDEHVHRLRRLSANLA